jgi:hypothetical protein
MKPVWYDHNADNPPWIKALADVRRMGTLEGYCYFHVQAIMLSIDQYAETALGNREYFLNKPHSLGGATTFLRARSHKTRCVGEHPLWCA